MKNKKRLLPLKEVCLDFIVPQRDKPTSFNGDIPWCRIEDIEGRYLNGSKSGQNVTKELADKMNMHLCPRGTVISACSASIGNQAITTTDCYTNQTFIGLVVNPDLLYNVYLYYFLESQTIALQQLGQGATIKYISKDKYKKMLIPLPSLSEQQRIVSRLDAAFAHIDELKANAEKELSEARALFQKALEKTMEPKEGWEEKTLGEVCEISRGKRFVRADIVENGIPCIHYGDIYTHYGLSVTKTRGCVKPELAKKLRFAKKNDVVVVQAGENNWDIGVGVAYFGEEPAVVHDACFILRHNQDPMYISYYLRSYKYHRYLVDYVHEGKICSFLKPALENAPIALPSLSEQRRIVARLDSLSKHVRELEEINKKLIAECDALKQALLRKVFE